MLQNDVSRDHLLNTTFKIPNLTSLYDFYRNFRFVDLLVTKIIFLKSVQKMLRLEVSLGPFISDFISSTLRQ